MKVLHVVGARPNFMKVAPIMEEMARYPDRFEQVLVHTGQHYDDKMSQVFFDDLDIPRPDVYLGVGSGSHAEQTARVMLAFEPVLLEHKPDLVLVVGDVNSTLACTLVATKLHIPVAHVEAGLRSFNRAMPEEVNRVLTDHISTLLFCPSQTAVDNLASEGIIRGVHLVGDVMADALAFAVEQARGRSDVLERLSLTEGRYLLATVHRAENTDDATRLRSILAAFDACDDLVIFPVHPRTRQAINALAYLPASHMRLIEPVGYMDMVILEQSARMILTDSGGIQKEAYWLGVPCVTLRDETEWVETVTAGWNTLVGADASKITTAVRQFTLPATRPTLYGDGHAAQQIIARMS